MKPFDDARDYYIKKVVSGKTFAEVGGLWGTVNEKISIADKFGASELTMIDITPLDTELWNSFNKRMKQLSVINYKSISADICEFDNSMLAKPFDVVHCSGVLYHHPNPLLLLQALLKITSKHLILTSAITQEIIENNEGCYRLPPSGVLFVPALSDKEREIHKVYWESVGAVAYGLTEKVQYHVNDFGPWWWLPTANALKAMCISVGFKVEESSLTWGGNALTLLLTR